MFKDIRIAFGGGGYADNETDSDAKMPRGIEAESVTREDNLLRTSLSLGREDCLLRAQEAHGGVEPAKHSVGTFNANEKIYSRKTS